MKRLRTLKDKLVSNKIWTSFSWVSTGFRPHGIVPIGVGGGGGWGGAPDVGGAEGWAFVGHTPRILRGSSAPPKADFQHGGSATARAAPVPLAFFVQGSSQGRGDRPRFLAGPRNDSKVIGRLDNPASRFDLFGGDFHPHPSPLPSREREPEIPPIPLLRPFDSAQGERNAPSPGLDSRSGPGMTRK